MPELPSIRAKVCLVGPPECGKTSLANRFVRHAFSESYVSTLGSRVYRTEVDLPGTPRARVAITLWDVTGNGHLFHLLQDACFYHAKGILAVVDESRPESWPRLRGYLESARAVAGEIPVILAANKVDAPHPDCHNDLENVAADSGCRAIVETSARTGSGVHEAFELLASALVESENAWIENVP